MNCILILLIILTVLIIWEVFSLDHFKTINSLNIKYNSKDVRVPSMLKPPNKTDLSLKEKINAELNKHPLTWKNQMYSMSVYPYVGHITHCTSNSDCAITAECNYNNVFDRDNGVGVCTVRVPDETVFNIKY